MEAQERQMAVERLKKGREKVLAAVEGLSYDQLTFRQSESTWSVADCLEHINLVENRIYKSIQRALSQPPEPERAGAIADKLPLIERGLLDRTVKFAGPEPLMPRREWTNFSELVEAFGATRSRTLQFAEQTTSPLHEYVFPHPVLADVDCYHWLIMIDLHAQRHIDQMEEIKASQAKSEASSAQA